MYYATIDNKIGQSESLPANAIEISAEQYKSLITDKMQGKRVTVEDGEAATYTECYSVTGEALKERDPKQPLITAAPTDGLHKPKWINGKWTEGETAADRSERFEDLRNRKYREISQAHKEHVAGSVVTSLGFPMQFDLNDSLMVEGAIKLAQANQAEAIYLTDAEDVTHYDISLADAQTVLLEMTTAFAEAHAKKQTLRERIAEAQTQSDLDAIVW